jgi:hypothetical protein
MTMLIRLATEPATVVMGPGAEAGTTRSKTYR